MIQLCVSQRLGFAVSERPDPEKHMPSDSIQPSRSHHKYPEYPEKQADLWSRSQTPQYPRSQQCINFLICVNRILGGWFAFRC